MAITEAHIRDFFYESATSYGFVKVEKELSVEGLRIDIFAIDSDHVPYIIEFKKKKDRHIVGQAAQYLAIVPAYREEISKKISFHKIDWDALSILLIAPDYYERDLTAANYNPLQNKVHFYTYKIVKNARSQIFGIPLKYIGPAERGPIILPVEVGDPSDLVDLHQHFEKLDTRESQREYYTNYVAPLMKKIYDEVKDFFEAQDLYFHDSYFSSSPPYYMIRVGTSKNHTHRASIILGFYQNRIAYGFDLTHSLMEGKLLACLFQDDQLNAKVIEEMEKWNEYDIYVPNTGFQLYLPICYLTSSAFSTLLKLYNPQKKRDCYFRITRDYTHDSLSVDQAVKILISECERFKILFNLLQENPSL